MTEANELVVRRLYEAYGAMDIPTIDATMSDDIVMHIAGDHPLSGDKVGKAAAWDYLGAVSAIGGGEGGFALHALGTDDRGYVVTLLTGTIRDFVRPVVHVQRLSEGKVVEFWDASLDQEQENAFWRGART